MNLPKDETIGFYINVGMVENEIVVDESQLNNEFMPKFREFKTIASNDKYDRSITIVIEPNEQWVIVHGSIVAEGFHLGTIHLALDELIVLYKKWKT